MREKLKEVEMFTDGACSGNPGPGGFGAILRYAGHEREICEGFASTTNNRMELEGVIRGLSCLRERCNVTVYTDSKYVVNGMEKGWAKKWRANGWRKSDKSPALNADLWEKLLDLSEIQKVCFIWVKGHAGHPENERCDHMAVGAYQKYRK